VFRTRRWWHFLACTVPEASRPSSKEQRSVALGLAWLWRIVPSRLVAAWSGLGGASSVRPCCNGADLGRGDLFILNLSEREMEQNNCYDLVFQQHLSLLSFFFFFFNMTCQYVID
jgi:hypothetical protein